MSRVELRRNFGTGDRLVTMALVATMLPLEPTIVFGKEISS